MASLAALPAVADQLLTQFAEQLTEQGVTLPERQYRQAGSMPVWDGEQMTVGLMGIAQGQPGMALTTTYVPQALNLYATFFILIVRAIQVVSIDGGFGTTSIPSAGEQDADGIVVIGDAQALTIAASRVHQRYLVTSPGEGFVIDGVQPLGPEGGLAATRLLLSLSLD